jgi:predicted MFS family arabinose efflux permease
MTPSILTGLLLIEIASTFNVDVGVAAQMRTLSSTIAMIFAIVIGVISVKIQAKKLMLLGLVLLLTSSLGCIFSGSMNVLLLSYSLVGFASAIISPMSFTMIGENLPIEKRSNAIGWIMTGASLAYVIGSPIINSLSDYGGWRLAFLGYVTPASILSLLLVSYSIPLTKNIDMKSNNSFLSGFKVTSYNRSALSCIFGNAMIVAAYQAILYFSSSFYREIFQSSKALASMLIVGSALSFTIGSQIGGRLIGKYGRKIMTTFPAFLASILIVSFMNIPNLYFSIVLRFFGSFVMAISFTSSRNLTLEQEPNFRGTMMSLNSASQSLGYMIGTGLGGYIILKYSYNLAGIALGSMGVLAAIVYWIFSLDPTQKLIQSN